MIEEIDLHLFLEIIATEGCILRYHDIDDNIYHYLSKFGNTKELIYGDDDALMKDIAETHLEKLELSYLIPRMSYKKIEFPVQETIENPET